LIKYFDLYTICKLPFKKSVKPNPAIFCEGIRFLSGVFLECNVSTKHGGNDMKKLVKWFGIIAFAAVVGFSIVGCIYPTPVQTGTQSTQRRLNTAGDYMQRALTHYFNERFDLAMEDINETIRLDRNYYGGYLVRGYVYREKGDYNLAINDFNEAIRLAPNPPPVYSVLAWTYAYYMKTNFDRALADVNQALR
jgi:tetratricopeptide (TPR) repeat protein